MTATPFRSDRQGARGHTRLPVPVQEREHKGYIKKLRASYVAPERTHVHR